MIHGFRIIAVLTVISRIFGLFRDMAFAYFLGAGIMMDIWVIAFKIPNLARRIFGEGAATSSFIPIYSRVLQNDIQSAHRLANTVLTVLTVLLSAIVVAGWIILGVFYLQAPLESTRLMLILAAVMLPYMVMICLEAMLGGMLNTHRHFAAPAAAPIVLNIINISCLIIGSWWLGLTDRQQLFFLSGGVLLTGVIQVAMQILPLKKLAVPLYPAWDIKNQAFKEILILFTPMILGMAVTQINTLADDIIAKSLSGSLSSNGKGEFFYLAGRAIRYPVMDGAVSNLFYAQRLYQFPLGVLGISLATAIFPMLSAAAAKRDQKQLAGITLQGIDASFFLALPSTAGLILTARPLIAAVFQRGRFTAADTQQAADILIWYAVGLCGFFLQQALPRTFYALKQSKTPACTAAAAVIINIILNLTLIWPMGAGGLALSTSICSYVQAGVMLAVLRRQGQLSNGRLFFKTLAKTLFSTLLMALCGIFVLEALKHKPLLFKWDAIRVVCLLIVCPAVYLASSMIFKNPMLSLILSRPAKKTAAF